MIIEGLLLALFAGIAIPVGALLSHIHFFRERWKDEVLRHTIIGFGAGALMAAVSFVLLIDGAKEQPHWLVLLTFFLGGAVFMGVDIILRRMGGRMGTFIAMLMDYVPEVIVLGAVVSGGDLAQALFLAVIIAAQNMPEGYASYLEMTEDGKHKERVLMVFVAMAFIGPVFSMLGTFVFASANMALGVIMTFSAGGILYLVFQDIAPRVTYDKSWLPPMGTIIGFMVGLGGYLYIH